MESLKKIEQKWQKKWEDAKVFEVDPTPNNPKYFITVAYPYPNSPQHIGHGRTYTLADVHARYMRAKGYNVLLPMAFHYTGTPVLAMSKRLAEKDKDLINDFVNVYKVPKERLEEFYKPLNMARYFHQEIKAGMKEIGYSIDWRREFTTIDPHYNRFIEWQFQKLREKGYITRGNHPVGWCPKDDNPVGQHDTLGDVEPEIGEFTLIKFKYDDCFLPAATLRPETIFGVTNIWLNPKVEYVKTKVDNEPWIISKEGAEKLAYLSHKVSVLESYKGQKFIGKTVINPATKEEVPILPAEFVESKNATGVVMSVPAHAPYDFVALESLKRDASLFNKFGLKPEIISSLNPISVIVVSEDSEVQVGDIVKKMEIEDQRDSKLEEATKEVYRRELHSGKMKANTGKYKGLKVDQAREQIKQDLLKQECAVTIYELLNRPVVCRCGTECVVRILRDQWFINYGDFEWKKLAHMCLNQTEILPKELRGEFNNVIDWLHEKACARRAGMGTKLPWDPEWIIESLSDSVIYMAYYTIVKQIKENQINPTQLTNEVFDYIFLDIGEAEEAAKKSGLSIKVLAEMRDEFAYFYPLDSRHSGRDLVPNHLSFMIFNHTAIFPKEFWPQQIVTNGSVLMQGAKMSKSFGNIISLRDGLITFGADPLRLAVLATAELLQDADFSPTLAKSMRDRLERLCKFALEILKKAPKKYEPVVLAVADRWMLSRLQKHVEMTTEAMEKLAVRKAIHNALYVLDQDLQWYLRRTSNVRNDSTRKKAIAKVINDVLNTQVRLLAPVAPHICEELWEKMGGEDFVSLAPWPKPDKAKIDARSEENEELIMSTLEDTLKIIKATSITPKRVCYYVAASWKWKAYQKALEKAVSAKVTQGELIKELIKDSEFKILAKMLVAFIGQIILEINKMSDEQKKRRINVGIINEKRVLKEAEVFFKKEFNTKISIYIEEESKRYDPKKRAQLAKPYRPAIYVE